MKSWECVGCREASHVIWVPNLTTTTTQQCSNANNRSRHWATTSASIKPPLIRLQQAGQSRQVLYTIPEHNCINHKRLRSQGEAYTKILLIKSCKKCTHLSASCVPTCRTKSTRIKNTILVFPWSSVKEECVTNRKEMERRNKDVDAVLCVLLCITSCHLGSLTIVPVPHILLLQLAILVSPGKEEERKMDRGLEGSWRRVKKRAAQDTVQG